MKCYSIDTEMNNMNMNDSLRIRACHAARSDSVLSIYCSSQDEDISTTSSTDGDEKIRKQQHLSATSIRRTIIYVITITLCMISTSMLIHLMNATSPFTFDTPFGIMMGYNEVIDPRVLSKCDEKISTKRRKRHETYDMSNEQQQNLDENELSSINFLSFDLGGSGLKFLPLSITEEEEDEDGILVKHVTPIGKEINLGRIPHHTNPLEWIEHQINDKLSHYKSINDWPQFGLAGRDNTFKLWAESEYDAVLELTTTFDRSCDRIEFNQLSIGCADIATTIPSWVRSKGLKYWCNRWRTADEVLEFSTFDNNGNKDDTFRGVFSDGRAHVEGARSKLQQISSGTNQSAEPTSFVSLAFGTGQTIHWTRDIAVNETASGTGRSYPGKKIASNLSSRKGVSNIFEILVDIPQRILDKHISLDLDGYKHVINGPLPFWMIMSGDLWMNPSISNEDLQEIYRHFFGQQVIKAIDEGLLVKPEAMVFSGGQEEHYHLAHMLSDILEERNIQAVAGYQSASHCGIARLSYPNSRVYCHFNDT